MTANVAELRAGILRAREIGNHAERDRLQGEYRALPLELRRELITAERVDASSGRRIVRSFASTTPRRRRRAKAAIAKQRAGTITLTDEQVGRLTNIDYLTDALDEEIDTLLDELGIADPDETTEPPEASKRSRGADDLPAASPNGTLYGHFAVFDTWTEVDSMWEGNFLESIKRGAFTDTIKSDRQFMKVTFNHGRDQQLGNKVLGPIRALEEDAIGVRYEVPLHAGIDALLMNGLRNGDYGASFRFYVMAEEFVNKPKASDYNPRSLPERTLTQIKCEEFGPVTFPQYPEATAQVRSVGDLVRKPIAAAPRAASSSRSREQWLLSLS